MAGGEGGTLKKRKNSTKQKKQCVFSMEFYWKIIGIQNSTKMSLTQYFSIQWNFEGIYMKVFGGNLMEF